jgi:hypothetical protein
LKRQIDLLFGLILTAFSTVNAVQINNLQKQAAASDKNIATITHNSQIQEEHLNHLDNESFSQTEIILNAIRYNPAILATPAHQVVQKELTLFIK